MVTACTRLAPPAALRLTTGGASVWPQTDLVGWRLECRLCKVVWCCLYPSSKGYLHRLPLLRSNRDIHHSRECGTINHDGFACGGGVYDEWPTQTRNIHDYPE